jgi:hypothetical protein
MHNRFNADHVMPYSFYNPFVKEYFMLKVTLCAFLTILSFAVMAEDHQHDHSDQHESEHRQHEAHQHGVASLNWVMDDNTLQVLLDSPAMNLLGFEHEPHDEEDKMRVDKVMEQLKNPDNVLMFNGGDCKLLSVEIENPFEEEAHEHGQVHEHETEHSDITAEYLFSCEQSAELTAIEITLFDTFSGFEKIDTQWIVNNQQGAATLSHDNHSLQLR